jgi:pimeloyl-ACP methyl ester carboxylesterase
MFYHPIGAIDFIAKSSWRHIKNNKEDVVRLCQAMEAELEYLDDYSWSLSLPILIINGQTDLWRDKTRETKCFRGSHVIRVELEECRHLPFIEQPIEFVNALQSFLLEHKSEGAA